MSIRKGAAARLALSLALVSGLIASVGIFPAEVPTFSLVALVIAVGAAGIAGLLFAGDGRDRHREVERAVDTLGRGAAGPSLREGRGAEWRALARAFDRSATLLRERDENQRSTRDRLEGVIASLEDGLLVVGRDGDVLFANPRAGELFAMPDSPTGHPALQIVRDRTFLDALDAALAGEAQSGEIRHGAVDPLSIRFRVAPFFAGERPDGAVALFHDITELRRAEAARSDFFANASHEIRTPLASVRGYAEILADREAADATSKKAVEAILSNAKRLSALVDDLLELSQIESGSLRFEPRPFDAGDLVAALLRDFEARAKRAGVETALEVEGDTAVEGDRRAFEQVVGNLLDNALKYSAQGGVARVSVGPALQPARLRVEVRDNGPGISLRHRDRVFERFFRVDPGRSREVGGTGLGLAIVKHLVQEGMGGEVGLESEPGTGSCFWFEIPRHPTRSEVR